MMDNAPNNDTMIWAITLGKHVLRFSNVINSYSEIYEKALILDMILLSITFAVLAILSTSLSNPSYLQLITKPLKLRKAKISLIDGLNKR